MSHQRPISDQWWRKFAYHWAIPRDNTLDGSQHARPALKSLSKSCRGCKDPPEAPCHPSKRPAQSVVEYAAIGSSTLVELVGVIQSSNMLQLGRSMANGLELPCQSGWHSFYCFGGLLGAIFIVTTKVPTPARQHHKWLILPALAEASFWTSWPERCTKAFVRPLRVFHFTTNANSSRVIV